MSKPMRILAMGAHPDDIELGCGATLAKLVHAGCQVRAIVITNGGRGQDELSNSNRHFETTEALNDLGIEDIHLENFSDTMLPSELNELTALLSEHIRQFKPDRVYTMYAQDRHQDHRAVYDATVIAGRSVRQIFSYETPSSWPNFNPTFFEEIGEWIDLKMTALGRHLSQAHRHYMGAEEVKARAVFRGSQVGVGPSEGFEIYKMVA